MAEDTRYIDDLVRPRRFPVKPGKQVTLTFEDPHGNPVTMEVENASLFGMGGHILQESAQPIADHDILQNMALQFNEMTVALGRGILQYAKGEGGPRVYVGISSIDMRLPLFGELGKMFDELNEASPLEYEIASRKISIRRFLQEEHSHQNLLEKCKRYRMLYETWTKDPSYQYMPTRKMIRNMSSDIRLLGQSVFANQVFFSSYDYLGLSQHPAVKDAAKKAIDKYGFSTGGSPMLFGTTDIHEELEHKLARLLGKDEAILFASGYAANMGVIQALTNIKDLKVADRLSHNSIQNAMRTSFGKSLYFRHGDHQHLHKVLKRSRGDHAGCLTITEGLFSMDGDVPDLRSFVAASKEHDATTFIDECHSFGILGCSGAGASEELGVLEQIDVYMATLSKAIGAGGGFIAGSRELVTWLRSFAQTSIFSGSLPPAAVGAALRALQVIEDEPERRERLQRNIRLFHEMMRLETGYEPISDIRSPIFPIVIGDQDLLGKMNQVLVEGGVFTNMVIFPAVPEKAARFRVSLSSEHTEEQLERTVELFAKATKKFGVQFPGNKQADSSRQEQEEPKRA